MFSNVSVAPVESNLIEGFSLVNVFPSDYAPLITTYLSNHTATGTPANTVAEEVIFPKRKVRGLTPSRDMSLPSSQQRHVADTCRYLA